MPGAPAGNTGSGVCVIMAGGIGSRFWPLSRSRRPKQLLALGSGKTLLRETFERVLPLVGADRILVVTQAAQSADTARELPELAPSNIIAEPVGRNTAPCAALGVGLAERLVGEGPVALLPADHWIPDPDLFQRQLKAALAHATATGDPVTIGIRADRPETGYGYLEVKEAEVAEAGGGRDLPPPISGLRFVEKPDAATARDYLASGRFFWNSGIFVWQSQVFSAALRKYLPQVASSLEQPLAEFKTPRFASALAAAYAHCPAVSLDVGIMEKLPRFVVYPAAFRWSDLGSWDVWGSLAPVLDGDNRGRTRLYPLDSRRNIVFAPDKAVALVGVDDLIVVDTPDALLVCRAQDAQRIRDLTALLASAQRDDLL